MKVQREPVLLDSLSQPHVSGRLPLGEIETVRAIVGSNQAGSRFPPL